MRQRGRGHYQQTRRINQHKILCFGIRTLLKEILEFAVVRDNIKCADCNGDGLIDIGENKE